MSAVTFVEYSRPGQNLRERNLRIAQARSHAAKASYPIHRRRLVQPSKRLLAAQRSNHKTRSVLSEEFIDVSEEEVPLTVTLTPSSGSHDPFGTYPVRIDQTSSATIKLFEVMWSRLAFTIPPSKDVRADARASRMHLVRESMQDSLLMSSLNGALQNRRKVAHRGSAEPRQYVATAVQLLRSRVDEGPGIAPSLFLPIMFLAHFEMHSANIAACKSHLRVLKQLGASSKFDCYAERFTRAIDSFCAMISLSRPVFDDIPRIDTLLLEDSAAASLFDLHERSLGKSLVDTARCIVDCVRAVEMCRQRVGQQSPVTPFMLRTGSRIYDLPHQLLMEMPGSAVKEACIIALGWWLLYAAHAAWELHRQFAAGEDARLLLHHWGPQLVKRLDDCEITSNLTLWFAASGMTFAASQDVFVSCAVKAATMASKLGIVDIRQSLKQYLWIEAFNLLDDFILENIDRIGRFAASQQHEDEKSMADLKQSLTDDWTKVRGTGKLRPT